ncbi:MAG: efflux RND transporter permease subunit [Candidatus Hinthialibacter antarcticus]|nr:efflux RND transporter permease subunit [Candidatus Hinthialibacter antarcticus]
MDSTSSNQPTQETVASGRRGMGAASFAVAYPVTISMFFIGVVMLGWISLNKLPTNLFPDLRAPRITVRAEAPGLAPQEVERIVIESMEGRVGTIKGVERVSSVARADSGAIIIDFNWQTDMDFAMLEVKKNVQGANIEEIESISTLRYDPNALPILTLGITGDRPLEEIRYLAERTVGPALERISGVARAETVGGLVPEIRCKLNPELLHFYGLTIDSVAQALEEANISATGGYVEEGNQRFMIRAIGEIKKLSEVQNAVIGYSDGTPIYMTDLGEAEWGFEEPVNAVHVDGKAGVGVALYKEAGANTVEVVKLVREYLRENAGLKDEQAKVASAGWGGGQDDRGQGRGGASSSSTIVPEDLKLDIAYDQSMFITRSIEEVKSTALQGVGLAALVLLIFLRNFRSTIIVALAIPVSILATFNLMYFMNLSLNIMTLGGLALGAGMLVDNAIVVIENIFRRRQLGDSPYEAAMTGAGEVASAIAAATLTTVVVFVPIAYMGGVTAQLFKEQALTVVFSLLTSLVVALMMIPALCARFLRTVPKAREFRESIYTRILRFSLRNRLATLLVIILITAASFPAFQSIKQEFIPQAAESQFMVKLRLPAGSELETTEHAAGSVEGWLSKDLGENIKTIYTRVGPKPDDTGAIDEEPEGSHTAEMMISMKEGALVSVPNVIEYLEPRMKTINGLDANFLLSQTSLSSLIGEDKSAIVIEIRGRSLESLAEFAREVKRRIDTLPEAANARTTILDGNPEVHLRPDRVLMAEVGLDQRRLVSLVQSQLRGQVATSIQDTEQTKDIRVQLGDGELNLVELKETIIPVGNNRVVTLGNLVDITIEPGPREILHRDQERIARVLADLGEGYKLSDSVLAVQEAVSTIPLPRGYSIRFGGEEERRRESFERLQFALILALVLVYMVMASLFESLMHPFVIMFSLPLAVVGVIWAFVLSGQTLNLMGYIGIIMLAGIVVNNAIVLIDYINYLRREEDTPMTEAIVQAGARRLRPILMTTATTVLALLPLALGFGEGAEIRAPMAVAVIGGLLSSTVLTLLVIPTIYSLFEDGLAFILKLFSIVAPKRLAEKEQQA